MFTLLTKGGRSRAEPCLVLTGGEAFLILRLLLVVH